MSLAPRCIGADRWRLQGYRQGRWAGTALHVCQSKLYGSMDAVAEFEDHNALSSGWQHLE